MTPRKTRAEAMNELLEADSPELARVERGVRPWLAALMVVSVLALAILFIACGGDGGDGDKEAATAAEEPTASQPIAPPLGDPKVGRSIFADNCSSCHGPDGGGGATGPSLQRSELQQEPAEVLEQIREGGGGMPAFGDELNPNQIADGTAYVTEVIAAK